MEMRKNIILLSMFFLNISCAQKLKLDAPSCNVFVNISNKKEKLKNITDTAFVYYNTQKEYLTKTNNKSEDLVSNFYKFEDFNFQLISQFSLKCKNELKFDCYSSIENYIDFENEPISYIGLVKSKETSKTIFQIEIPNYDDVINNLLPDVNLKEINKNENLRNIHYMSVNNSNYIYWNNEVFLKNNNFLFKIFGLYNVVFEIEINSGKLYAYYLDESGILKKRDANELIKNDIGITVINELINKNFLYYEDNIEIIKCPN
jgi:hypothetical protein